MGHKVHCNLKLVKAVVLYKSVCLCVPCLYAHSTCMWSWCAVKAAWCAVIKAGPVLVGLCCSPERLSHCLDLLSHVSYAPQHRITMLQVKHVNAAFTKVGATCMSVVDHVTCPCPPLPQAAVMEVRNQEANILKRIIWWQALFIMLLFSGPVLMAVTVFAV